MNGKKVISILLFVVALAMIGSGIYLMNSKKYIFETAMKKVFSTITEVSNETLLNEMLNSDKYKITTDTKMNLLGEPFISVSGDYHISNNDIYFNLDSKVAEEDFIGLEAFLDDDRMYYKIKEAMETFYYTDLAISDTDGTSSIPSFKTESLEKKEFKLLVNLFRDSILDDLKDNELNKSSETLNLGSKEVKTTKISLSISEKKFFQIIIKYLDLIGNDTSAIKALQKLDSEITKEYIEEIKASLEEKLDASDTTEILNIAFYLEGFNNVRRIELSLIENYEIDSEASNTYTISYDSYTNSSSNKVIAFKILENDIDRLSYEGIYTTDSNIDITLILNNEEQITTVAGTLILSDSELSLDVTASLDEEEIAVINYKVTRVTKDKEYKMEFSFYDTSQENGIVSMNTIYLNEDLPTIDTESATDAKEVSEEEMDIVNSFVAEKINIFSNYIVELFAKLETLTPETPTPNDGNLLDNDLLPSEGTL